MQPGISFFTCTYEADWEYLLIEGRLSELIKRFNYSFASRNLIINNVDDKKKVKHYALKAVNDGVIDNFYFSEEYVDEVLRQFSLKRSSFKLDGFDGYWFSVAPLTSVFLCATEYMLYFTADCILKETYSSDWLNAGISKLQNDKIFIVTPLWDYYDSNKEKFVNEDECCFYDGGFSDQAYMAKAERLKSVNFNEYNVRSEIFPIYGGNHFERRLFSYINNRNLQRCIFKDIIYKHELLIKPGYKRKIGSTFIMDKLKYTVARVKKRLRKKNIMRNLLLR
jgi:hypothetical protein